MPEESLLRLIIFVGVLCLMLALQALFPRRKLPPQRLRRLSNLSLAVLNTFCLKLLGPVSAMAVAAYASAQGWGLLNILFADAWLGATLVGVLFLDFAIYWQHVLSHRIPLLWRLHKVHHADKGFDVTTAVRFHPIEAVLSMLLKCLLVLLFGLNELAVLIFEILLNASAMFNHANLRLPLALDRWLRKVLVTPDFHRVHHSVVTTETNSNYGFFLSVWDRLFATYQAQPKVGHNDMIIGLDAYQKSPTGLLPWCLSLPFKREANKS